MSVSASAGRRVGVGLLAVSALIMQSCQRTPKKLDLAALAIAAKPDPSLSSYARATRVEWFDFEPESNGLVLYFIGGRGPSCGHLFRVDRTESPRRINVRLLLGVAPADARGDCYPVGQYYKTEITLAAPVDDRVVVDLETGEPVPPRPPQ